MNHGKAKSKHVMVNVTQCKYEAIRMAARERGWKLIEDEDSPLFNRCNIHWIDVPEIQEHFKNLLPYQKINHFPGMSNIARKSRLAKNIERIRKKFPKEYDFCPRTWILPLEFSDFRQQFNQNGDSSKTFIVKPDAGCQGRGVYLTRQIEKISRTECQVAQRYIRHPLLIGGKKFDLRVYVLMTSCAPLSVYMFNDGLVRLCTTEYVTPSSSNLEQRYMHLTNYAINKHSEDFIHSDPDNEEGSNSSKRSIQWFLQWFATEHGENEASVLWSRIGDVCLKTLIAIQPTLEQEYNSAFAKYARKAPDSSKNQSPRSGSTSGLESEKSLCFEILGFDILVDVNFKPWLIEVNHLPSFKCDAALDKGIKSRLIAQTFDLLGVSANDGQLYDEQQSKHAQLRLWGGVNEPRSEKKFRNLATEPFSRTELIQVITRFYEDINRPDKLLKLDKMLEKYQENQIALNENLLSKYNIGLLDVLDVAVTTNPAEVHRLADFVRLYPAQQTMHEPTDYMQILKVAKQQLDELQLRLYAPLHQRRGTDIKLSLPAVKFSGRRASGRDCFGINGTDRAAIDNGMHPRGKKDIPEPTPAQAAAALRLMQGYSSQATTEDDGIKPAPPDIKRGKPQSYGQAYRQRLEGMRRKPTVRLAQITLGSFGDS